LQLVEPLALKRLATILNWAYNNKHKEIYLFSDEEINSLNLLLFDINGRVVKVESLRNIKEANWSLQFLTKGFYIASLKFNNQIKNLKFVIN